MPTSDRTAREMALSQIIALAERRHIRTFIDVGAGAGAYGCALKEKFPTAYILGIEIWPEYLKSDHMQWYNSIVVQDVRQFTVEPTYYGALAIFGDVLEHMEKPEAVAVIAKFRNVCDVIVASIPLEVKENGIVYWMPQSAQFGNPYEAHRYNWPKVEVERDLGLKCVWEGKVPNVNAVFTWERNGKETA